MYGLIKQLLFLFSAERAHSITTSLFDWYMSIPIIGSIINNIWKYEDQRLAVTLWGLTFTNPIGLAAGFDKNGEHIEAMAALGFGFIEVGTVTPRPQAGNPKPRLFRLRNDEGIINRMGFNNDGVDVLVENLKRLKNRSSIIIGGNIGKNKDTSNDEAYLDYLICFKKLYDFVDYFVVNLSSPNTPGLRDLQEKAPLTKILKVLLDEREKRSIKRPILLKIAPDLSDEQINDVIEIVLETGIEGVIATNTTISRQGLNEPQESLQKIGNGGLSGKPLKDRANEVVRYIQQQSRGQISMIGVGGIDSADSAIERLHSGAKLIQVYSGVIYQGPELIKKIKKGIIDHLSK